MTNFIRAANPIWWIPDLTGFPLNDEYYAFFLTNDLPYIFEPVYQDVNGLNPWAAPLQFQPAGTLPNNLYFDETKTYRIEIRHGNTSADQLIYLIENFIPGNNVNPSNTSLLNAENMITNPQFADVYFNTPPGSAFPTFTYVEGSSGNYSVDIGPGWRIDLQGNGSLTVTQTALDGSSNKIGDPNYYLTITNTGWTSVKLIQRFSNNGALFFNGAIGVAFTAFATGSSQTVRVQYQQSSTSSPIPDIFVGSIPVGDFSAYGRVVNLPASDNTDLGENAYVDVIFNLPSGSTLSFTNISVVGQTDPVDDLTLVPQYPQQTYERTLDHEFNVYQPWLYQKRIPSKLVGWDFPLNPAQFIGSTVPAQNTGANSSFYAWDQTIVFQSVTNGVTIDRTAGGALRLTAVLATQMAIIQYMDTFESIELLSDAISTNIAAISSVANGVNCTVSLWYTTDVTLPSTKIAVASGAVASTSFVTGLDANGKPNAFSSVNWKEVPRGNLQNATLSIKPTGDTTFNDYNFIGWNMEGIADVNTTTYFAIVIGTSAMSVADTLSFQSIGLMNGNIATRPGAQTKDEVLRQCQYFYEKSFELGETPTFPAAPNFSGANIFHGQYSATSPVDLSPKTFSITFKTVKRIAFTSTSTNTPLIIYDPNSGAAGHMYAEIHQPGGGIGVPVSIPMTSFVFLGSTTQTFSLKSNSPTPLATFAGLTNALEGVMYYHYVADARLGF